MHRQFHGVVTWIRSRQPGIQDPFLTADAARVPVFGQLNELAQIYSPTVTLFSAQQHQSERQTGTLQLL